MSKDRDASHALSELCVDAFVLASQIQQGHVELPGCEALKRRVLLLFESMESRAPKMGLPHGDVEQARYALAAFIDEAIQYSSWPGKDEWAHSPLQAILFNETRAGTHFFDRLAELRQQDSPALRVYYTCLALGFLGEYRMGKLDAHDRLVAELGREVVRPRKLLSVHGKRPDDKGLGRRGLPAIPLAGAAVSLSLLVVLVLYGVLWWSGSNAVELLIDMGRR